MHKYPFIILLIITIVSTFIVLFSNTDSSGENEPLPTGTQTPNETTPAEFLNYSASFLIFTNGTKRTFSALMYHNLSPDVYITSQNPEVIQITKSGTTWQDFFSTLPMGLSDTCLTTGTGQSFCSGDSGDLRFFINGDENPNALAEVIRPQDKLLVTYGVYSNAAIQAQLSQIPDPVSTTSANTTPSTQ